MLMMHNIGYEVTELFLRSTKNGVAILMHLT